MATVNVTVGFTPQMLTEIDRQWQDDPRFGSRAEYIRACVRSDNDVQLPVDDLDEADRVVA